MSSVPPTGPDPADRSQRPGPYGAPGPFAPQQVPGAQGMPGGPGPARSPEPPAPAPGSDLGADLGAALRWMWQAFARNVPTFLVPAIVWSVVAVVLAGGIGVVGVIVFVSMVDGTGPDQDPPLGPFLLLIGITVAAALLAALASFLWQTGAARAAGLVREGRRPRLGEGFVGGGRLLATALLVGVLVFVGTLLLYLPGLALAILTFYALPAAARGARPIAAIKESFSLATSHIGTTLVAYVILLAASSVLGFVVVGVVLLVPLLVLFQFGLYERLSGRALPEPVRPE